MALRPDRRGISQAERLFRQLPKELKSDIRRVQRAETLPIWKEEINSRRDVNPLAARVHKAGITVKTGAEIVLVAKGSTKKIGRRGIPLKDFLGVSEFGSQPNSYTKYNRRSSRGKAHTVTRRTRAGLPHQRARGYVVIPAARPAISRIQSLTVATTVRRLHLAAEGR